MFDGCIVFFMRLKHFILALSFDPSGRSNAETGSLTVHVCISQQGKALACKGGNTRINTPRHTQLVLFLNSVPIEQHLLSSLSTPTSKSPTSLSARKAFCWMCKTACFRKKRSETVTFKRNLLLSTLTNDKLAGRRNLKTLPSLGDVKGYQTSRQIGSTNGLILEVVILF